MTEIIHLVNYEAASGWFFSPEEIGFTNYEEVDLSYWLRLLAQDSVQNQSVTNGVITQEHNLVGNNLAQSQTSSNGSVDVIIQATHLNNVSMQTSVPITDKVLTATSSTTADWL